MCETYENLMKITNDFQLENYTALLFYCSNSRGGGEEMLKLRKCMLHFGEKLMRFTKNLLVQMLIFSSLVLVALTHAV